MAKEKVQSFISTLSDRFTDVWKLLSETTTFLSRTNEFHHYEQQLRLWRAELQSRRQDVATVQPIRDELITLRKNLRLQGYDLNLARQSLKFEGFRNDACIAEGFRRLVLVITEDDIYWLAGDDNHITLAERLEHRLESVVLSNNVGHIIERHYLWYKRQGPVLILSGSDTESKEDFERLKAIGEANPLLLLSKLYQLK